MNFLTKTLTAVVAAAALIGTAPKVEARGFDFCMSLYGGEVCANYGTQDDEVVADIPGFGMEVMIIKCIDGDYDFYSEGDWSYNEVDIFVSNYCTSVVSTLTTDMMTYSIIRSITHPKKGTMRWS